MNDLTRRAHRLDADRKTCRVIVETPKGCRSKCDYDPDLGTFQLAERLPEGMSFPLDFGSIPSTKAEDGDPLDVLILAGEPTAMGAVLDLRLVGVIEAEQTEEETTLRNDRLLAVACASKLHAQVRDIADLGGDYLHHLGEFWAQYNALKGKRGAPRRRSARRRSWLSASNRAFPRATRSSAVRQKTGAGPDPLRTQRAARLSAPFGESG